MDDELTELVYFLFHFSVAMSIWKLGEALGVRLARRLRRWWNGRVTWSEWRRIRRSRGTGTFLSKLRP